MNTKGTGGSKKLCIKLIPNAPKDLRLVRPHRRPPARLPQNPGIADAARTDRSDGRYRAGGGLLRFIRFEMDHRRNTTHRGRSSLGIYRKRLQQHERKIKNEN